MSETLKWSYQTTAVGGPTLAAKGEMQVDAYMKFSVTVSVGTPQPVEILTDDGGALLFLIISPKSPSDTLSYTAGDGPAIVLDGPHVLIGEGAVGLLAASVGLLTFTNGGTEAAEISILAGRDATSTAATPPTPAPPTPAPPTPAPPTPAPPTPPTPPTPPP